MAMPVLAEPSIQDDSEKINEIWASCNATFQSGKFEEAKDRISEFIELLPFEPSSRILMARCQAKLGENDEAVSSLEKASELGWEDTTSLKKYPELAKLIDTSDFKKVLADMEGNLNRKFAVYMGNSVDRNKAAPLIVLFHGRGELPAVQMYHWKEAADRAGWIILAPKGTRNLGSVYAWERPGAKRTWEVDSKAIHVKTNSIVKKMIATSRISKVVLAGFSQGGVVAFELLVSDLQPRPAGCVVFATAFPKASEKQMMPDSKTVRQPIIIHVGREDRWLEGNQDVAKSLKENKASVDFTIWDRIGHQMPPNHTQVILDSVDKVLRHSTRDKEQRANDPQGFWPEQK